MSSMCFLVSTCSPHSYEAFFVPVQIVTKSLSLCIRLIKVAIFSLYTTNNSGALGTEANSEEKLRFPAVLSS